MHWKDKLEGLTSLAHESCDTNYLWEKLDSRINKKPLSRKILNGMVLVAASLMWIAGFIWITRNKKDADLYSSSIYKPADTKRSSPIEIDVEKEIAGSKKQYPQPKNKVANQIIAPKKNFVSPVIETTEKQKIEPQKEETNSGPLTITDSVVGTSRPLQTLRIVHINELGKPARENIRLARASQSANDGYSKKAVPIFFSNNADDNIFKIKFSPSKSE